MTAPFKTFLPLMAAACLCGIAGCGGCRREPVKPAEPVSRHKDPVYQAALRQLATNDLPRLQRAIKAAGTNTAEIARLQNAYLAKARATVQAGIWKENAGLATNGVPNATLPKRSAGGFTPPGKKIAK